MTISPILRPAIDMQRLLTLGLVVVQVVAEPTVQRAFVEAYVDTRKATKSVTRLCGEVAAAWRLHSGAVALGVPPA